jgi:hypothetical protein
VCNVVIEKVNPKAGSARTEDFFLERGQITEDSILGSSRGFLQGSQSCQQGRILVNSLQNFLCKLNSDFDLFLSHLIVLSALDVSLTAELEALKTTAADNDPDVRRIREYARGH